MIRLEKVSIHQGDFSLSEIDLQVNDGAYATLMGPSGVGKTTLLESICGLRRVKSGRIFFGDQEITKLAASQREVGFVPQDLALFPTMRVDHQIGFGLSVRKQSASSIKTRVDEIAELLEIAHLLERFPGGLSGGEQQRVALGRAIAFRPKLLCLDEPLSSLDEPTRIRMVELLKNIHEYERVTVLHVTHNQGDALSLATQKFELDSGRIHQTD